MKASNPFIQSVEGSEFGHLYQKNQVLSLPSGDVRVVSTLLHKSGYEQNRAYFLKTIDKVMDALSSGKPKHVTKLYLEQDVYALLESKNQSVEMTIVEEDSLILTKKKQTQGGNLQWQ